MESAVQLSWTYGASPVPGSVINLSNAISEKFFFVSSNTAVIQDVKNRSQTILQGHISPITAICSCADRAMVVTADGGNDSILVAWSTASAQPLFTAAHPHGHGILCMDISQDGSKLVTISKPPEPGAAQYISLWDISSRARAECAISVLIPAGDEQMCVRFNENDTTEIMSNGEIRVFFWRSCLPATAAFQYYSPPLASADFKQKIGKFTASTFIPGTKQAVTGTCDGDVVVWDAQGVAAEIGTRAEDRKATKLVRLHLKSITWLSSIGDFIVSGGGDGFVRFFDPMLRLIAWFEHINAGPICAVSFSCATLKPDPAAAANLDHFLCPDFVCSTANGCIVSLTAAAFNTPDAVSRCGQILLAGLPRQITACIAHPMQPLFLVIGACGTMQLWDSHLHAPTLNIPPPLASSKDALRPKCAVYSRTGTVVVVGCADGAVFVLNAADLSEVVRIKQSKAPICTVAISTSGKHFAAATDDGHVLLANLVPFKHTLRWEFIGRAKVHYTRIIAVHFGEAPSGETRCFSLSEDGCLSEYNLTTSSLEAGVVVCNQLVLPHPAAPSAMSFTPPLSYYEQGVIDTQLVIADSALAIRVFNPDTAVTSSTLRGPTFGGPLVQLAMFQTAANSATLVAFRSKERTAGVMMWPSDGHPSAMTGMLAHPGDIVSMSVSYDGNHIFTASSNGQVNQWTVNAAVLENATAVANSEPDKWLQAVGQEADIEAVRRLFVFGQVRAQGEDSTEERKIGGHVPLDHVPELMCALGYHPTQADITDMISSLAYNATTAGDGKHIEVDLPTFCSLFYNFRPVKQIKLADVEEAFVTLGASRPHKALSAERFVEALTTLGEKMDAEELAEAMQLLTGRADLSKALPSQLTPSSFLHELLGLEAAA